MEPLAEARELEIERVDVLAEGVDPAEALAFLRAPEGDVAACVHGDLVEALLGRSVRKGSTTVLDVEADPPVVIERLPPPGA